MTGDDIAVGHILARHAAVAVAVANATKEQSLRAAIDARKLIGEAMGILMERYKLDSDQAFAVLRRYSQDYNIKLREVAQRLIDTRQLPEPPASTPTVHPATDPQTRRERPVPGQPR